MSTSEESPLSVSYLTTTRLGEKGQITVPKEFRDTLALDTGAPIAVLKIGPGLMLIPEHTRFLRLCDRIADTFSRHEIQTEDILETLPETRERVVARHYPGLIPSKPAAQKKRKR